MRVNTALVKDMEGGGCEYEKLQKFYVKYLSCNLKQCHLRYVYQNYSISMIKE